MKAGVSADAWGAPAGEGVAGTAGVEAIADGAGAAGAAGVEAGALAGVDGAWEVAAEEGAGLGCKNRDVNSPSKNLRMKRQVERLP